MKKESTFNIFHILSAGDKELVHSSMLKFLIEEYHLFRKEFLGDPFEDKELYIKLEHSEKGKVEYQVNDELKTNNKYIRFDLVVQDKEGKWLFAIENKFKATPTVKQLQSYDNFFSKNKDKLHSNFEKLLIIFSAEQIPLDVELYRKKENWKIRSYFDFHNPTSDEITVIKILEKINKTKIDNPLLMTLSHQYGDYLESIKSILKPCFENISLLSGEHFKDLANGKQKYNILRDRDLWFRYLLHLQSLISKKVIVATKINSEIEYNASTGNDGGSRPIPSVPFWGKNNKFFTFDGDSMKIGFWYYHNKSEIAAKIKEELNIQLDKSEIWVKYLNGKINNTKIKTNGNSSVLSLVSYDVKNWKNKEKFINDASTIFNEYFKLYDQCKLVEKLI